MSESISFEHAADFYDATRALPDEVAAKLTDALMRELARVGADRLLEVGVGTGRISRPLMRHGIRVTGCDISSAMMGRLRAELDDSHVAPDLLLADATRLPFADDSVPAALIVHVLHLVSSMTAAVAELARVIQPHGVLLQDTTRYRDDEHLDGGWVLFSEVVEDQGRTFQRRRRPEPEDVHRALVSHGAELRIVNYVTHQTRRTPRERLERVRNRVHSWTWEIPDDVFADVFPEFERRYHERFPDLDKTYPKTHINELEVWTFP